MHQLRTVEQLGYLVWCGARHDAGVVGLRVIIQSATHEPRHLDSRIEEFFTTVPEMLSTMGADEFATYRRALLDLKLQKDKTLRQETSRYWSEIPHGTLDFERSQKDAEARTPIAPPWPLDDLLVSSQVLADVTQRELVEFWDAHLRARAPNRRKLCSQADAAEMRRDVPRHGALISRARGAGGRGSTRAPSGRRGLRVVHRHRRRGATIQASAERLPGTLCSGHAARDRGDAPGRPAGCRRVAPRAASAAKPGAELDSFGPRRRRRPLT